jgi:glutamate-1-semialdehyde 2,1-aminomutase
MSAGTLDAVTERTVTFDYNDLSSVKRVFDANPGRIACVIMEAERTTPPAPEFLPGVQAMCRGDGALFILDEMITGFRWSIGGAQAEYGLQPDLSTFGKALANGFSVSAILGRRDVMELGGFDHDRRRVFLASTTHGGETHALAAAIATMDAYVELDVVRVLHERGRRLAAGLTEAARVAGVQDYFEVVGRPCNLVYATRDADGRPSQPFRTLFLQETMDRGLLMPSLVVNYSHSNADIEQTVEKVAGALEVYRRALHEGVPRHLRGRSVRPTFRGIGDLGTERQRQAVAAQ